MALLPIPEKRGHIHTTIRVSTVTWRGQVKGAGAFTFSPKYESRLPRPRVTRHRDRSCVFLATDRRDGGGSYYACYDRRTGALVEERVTIGF